MNNIENENTSDNIENTEIIDEKMLPEALLTKLQDTAKEWARIQLIYESALKQINTKIEILSNEFKLVNKYNPIEHVTSRIKSPESISKKLKHNDKDLTMDNIVSFLNDVAGIRIICSFTSDIYRIADMLANQSDITVLKIKDYIANPKPNGYKSYHMIVSVPVYLSEGPVDAKVEIQIRTIAMDFWASLEHKIYYKYEGNAPKGITRELKECADLAAFLDAKMLALNEEINGCEADDEEVFEEVDFTELDNENVKASAPDNLPERAAFSDNTETIIEVVTEDDQDDMATLLRKTFSRANAAKQ